MKIPFRSALIGILLITSLSAFAPVKRTFTAAEQQQISIATPGLFARGNTFTINFRQLSEADYSFPLPVGKATLEPSNNLRIATSRGDAVKAMFGGMVRLSRKSGTFGNVIVIRHENGLETVYGSNAQNLVKVGETVKAGQTIAIVGGKGADAYCDFAIMVNGGRINPGTIIDINSHRLRMQTVQCARRGRRVDVTIVADETLKKQETGSASTGSKATVITSLNPDTAVEDVFAGSSSFKLNLENIEKEHWAYPLPGAHVISPYGGRRNHGGVDVKTKPNDEILAAFDGVVTRACAYFGYGNCIVIKHAYGFETLYSHQSKNHVKVGQKVKAGQVIGLTGRTGRATTEHLHFEMHYKGRRFNPSLVFDHVKKKLRAATLHLTKTGGISSKAN